MSKEATGAILRMLVVMGSFFGFVWFVVDGPSAFSASYLRSASGTATKDRGEVLANLPDHQPKCTAKQEGEAAPTIHQQQNAS